MVMIKMMSRWALALLAFTFFIFTPTMVLVCDNVFSHPKAHDPCFEIPLFSQPVVAQTNQTIPMDLPLDMMAVAATVFFAAAVCDVLLSPQPFTLLPQTPPPR